MTTEEIKEITILQKRGIGYMRAATITSLPSNKVKYYMGSHPVNEEDVCMECGKSLSQTTGRRMKTFCSRSCKSKWWNRHSHMMKKQTLNNFICPVCGKEFSDYGKRIYCSRGCYAEARRKK